MAGMCYEKKKKKKKSECSTKECLAAWIKKKKRSGLENDKINPTESASSNSECTAAVIGEQIVSIKCTLGGLVSLSFCFIDTAMFVVLPSHPVPISLQRCSSCALRDHINNENHRNIRAEFVSMESQRLDERHPFVFHFTFQQSFCGHSGGGKKRPSESDVVWHQIVPPHVPGL